MFIVKLIDFTPVKIKTIVRILTHSAAAAAFLGMWWYALVNDSGHTGLELRGVVLPLFVGLLSCSLAWAYADGLRKNWLAVYWSGCGAIYTYMLQHYAIMQSHEDWLAHGMPAVDPATHLAMLIAGAIMASAGAVMYVMTQR